MDPIKISFTWNVDDLIAGRRWHFRQLLGLSVDWVMLLVFGPIYFWITFQRNDPPIMMFVSVVLFGLGVVAYLWVYPKFNRWFTNLQFFKRPDANLNIEWTISPERLICVIPLGNSELQWSFFAKVLRTPDGYLFYPNNQIFHFLPNVGF